jgi:hypothetical protein
MSAPDEITKSCFNTLLAATAADNFEQFVSVGDEKFKRGLHPEVFHRVSRGLASRMQKGVTPTFLGELRQGSYTASLWRLRFDDGGDDLLFRMAVAGGRSSAHLSRRHLVDMTMLPNHSPETHSRGISTSDHTI